MFKKLLAAATVAALAAPAAFAADLEGRVLKIGTDATYPPMETVDEATGKIVGFDVDVMNAICAEINCVPNFVNTAWDGIFAALQQGEFDLVISGVSITPEREETMDFSEPYIVVSQAILLRVDDASMTLGDFKAGGKKLAAQTGTTNAQLAEELVGRENVSLYDNFSAAILALQNADVHGVIIDGTSAAAYEQEFAGELTVGITGLKSDPLGIVFQEGDATVDAVNEGLAAIKADGTLDKLIGQYWGTN
ncbi:basic amino acid ABC transporter substrate-binding protein [Ruegeria sp. HKCCD8929]|uniref:basic amino acid ABC transporter substrate-binding protein n=1 Tax=Ruegeria sp. HKCCD8929 TaxID=2683006 RepID=UPI0014887BB1|nr:basic amino acid ABC transporter substrate-binding protein [Ruegeria sp. HKCCD8929]